MASVIIDVLLLRKTGKFGGVIHKAKLNTNVGETARTDPKCPGKDMSAATYLAKTNLWR